MFAGKRNSLMIYTCNSHSRTVCGVVLECGCEYYGSTVIGLQCVYNQWPVGVRILNRSLFEVRHFVALRGKHVEYKGSNRQRKKIIIPFSKNAGHLLISRDRGTSDENAGLSLRMRVG